ncbi:hypothetical protein KKG29_00265 [Patescibacteria group bacterium]|nr:hypothetical protein [Patescibacteria group bacterium]MBU3999604.1 hypothetical protein [Patescibacteria group bacterium]MBU4056344.1 hypothetical protein [Patescibacteria group bacterium]MBU4368962.1 hypothetical protein [Patescibacteria group bacterium]
MNKKKKNIDFDPIKVGKAEFGWYKSHHFGDYDGVIRQMTLVYQMLFGLKPKIAREIMLLKIAAAKEHDLAEKEGISKNESDKHWKKGEELMIEHFKMLKKALSEAE